MVHGSRADRGGDRGRFSVSSCLLGERRQRTVPCLPVSSLTDCSAFFQKSAVLRESRTDGHDGVFQGRIRL